MSLNNNSITAPRMIEAALHEQQALDLRIAGVSYRDIAKAIGLSPSGAHKAVDRALAEIAEQTNEKAERVRSIELQRLDKMSTAVWKEVVNGNYAAIDRALRIQERRSRLLGLDAPERKDVTNHNRQVILYVPDNGREPSEAPQPVAGQECHAAGVISTEVNV